MSTSNSIGRTVLLLLLGAFCGPTWWLISAEHAINPLNDGQFRPRGLFWHRVRLILTQLTVFCLPLEIILAWKQALGTILSYLDSIRDTTDAELHALLVAHTEDALTVTRNAVLPLVLAFACSAVLSFTTHRKTWQVFPHSAWVSSVLFAAALIPTSWAYWISVWAPWIRPGVRLVGLEELILGWLKGTLGWSVGLLAAGCVFWTQALTRAVVFRYRFPRRRRWLGDYGYPMGRSR